jgi:hypothetical protein
MATRRYPKLVQATRGALKCRDWPGREDIYNEAVQLGQFRPIRLESASSMFDLIALVCAGLFAGAALYVSFVEHPARVACGTELALKEFGPSYHRGAIMQASLAILGVIAAVVGWLLTSGVLELVGGLVLGALVPYTLVVIMPTNKRLLDARLDARSPEASELLHRWGQLHAVRSAGGTVAFLLLLAHLVG